MPDKIVVVVKRISITTYVAYMGSEPAYVAFLKMEPGKWEIGKTYDEALSKLIINNKELFALTIEDVEE